VIFTRTPAANKGCVTLLAFCRVVAPLETIKTRNDNGNKCTRILFNVYNKERLFIGIFVKFNI